MNDALELQIDGRSVRVARGTTVAAAILSNRSATRTSVRGQPRAPLCGMGICFECVVTIDGVPGQRSCQIVCRPGMAVQTSVR